MLNKSAKISEGHTYKGVTYFPEVEREIDGPEKIFHAVRLDLPRGYKQGSGSMDWSPYKTPTVAQYEAWVDLGLPRRTGTGPLTEQDLIALGAR